jgi:hypothetical protein
MNTQAKPVKIGTTDQYDYVGEIRLLYNNIPLKADGYTDRQFDGRMGQSGSQIAQRMAEHLRVKLGLHKNSEAEIQVIQIEMKTPADIIKNTCGETVTLPRKQETKVMNESIIYSSKSAQ